MLLDSKSEIISASNNEIATLTITGRGRNRYGHITVYCKFEIKNIDQVSSCNQNDVSLKEDTENNVDIIPLNPLLQYREYENLSILLVGSAHKISAIGHARSYGRERLIVKIGERIYQAGEYIEAKLPILKKNTIIKIEKIRLNKSTRTKYAICSIYEPGDWTAHVDYKKTPILTKHDGSTCIVDVKDVEVKGIKRKLLLADDGSVYKLKKSKLEKCVKPGFL